MSAPTTIIRTSPEHTEHVLIVEDEEIVRTLLERLVVGFGYLVQSVPNGDEALQLIEGGARFDLLLTDMVLPGMSGRELAEQVAAVAPAIKILLMSGYDEDEVNLRGAGTSDYLAKPFTPGELAARVRSALDAG